MFAKKKPYRSKKFLSFCHEHMTDAPCCICRNRQWEQLHHLGADGGTGMKASDNEVARLCNSCHSKIHSEMGRTLPAKASMYPATYAKQMRWFVAMQGDALLLNRAWIEHLEGK